MERDTTTKKKGRPVTHKLLSTHFECVCGRNVIEEEELPIRWKDFSKAGIVRKIDKSSGNPFLLQIVKSEVCTCYED